MRRCSLEPVPILAETGFIGLQLVHAVEEDGRGSFDRHVDDPAAPLLATPAFDESGAFALLALTHSFAPGRPPLTAVASPKTNRKTGLSAPHPRDEAEQAEKTKDAPGEALLLLLLRN